MGNNPLDLNRLTMDDIDFSKVHEISKNLECIEAECKEKYGDDWFEHYFLITNPRCNIDSVEEVVNRAIYDGCELVISGSPTAVREAEMRYKEKMKRIFGIFYKQYMHHKPNDPKINRALLNDAIISGKWRELPNELQEEYHKLAGK